MSRRQIRRNFEGNVRHASVESDGTAARLNARSRLCNPCNPCPPQPCPPCGPCQPCAPTLAQRVACLESEVSDLNCAVAELAVTCHSPNSCNPANQYPFNDPFYPKAVNQSGDTDRCHLNSCHPSGCHPNPLPPSMRPPIVFDGYSLVYRQVTVNGVPAAFWFLVPESSTNPDVYRFTWISSSNTYIYEPVNPNNFSQVYPPSATDALHITYIYQDIPTRGFGLRPYLYLGIATNPHTIIGYEYVPLVFGTAPNTTTEYCYVPLLPNPNVTTPYTRNITLSYEPIVSTTVSPTPSNTYAADQSTIGSVTKLPFEIFSNDMTDVMPEVVPIGTDGVGFILPYDDRPYTVSFGAELRVNTDVNSYAPNTSSYINMLSLTPAIARLTLWRVTPSGPVQLTVPSSDIILTAANLNVTPIQDPAIPSQAGLYRSNTIPTVLPTYTITPDPTTRTIMSVAVSEGYSFERAVVVLSRQ